MLEKWKRIEINENASQALTCPIAEDDLSIAYEWSKNGAVLFPSANIQFSLSRRTLHIMHAQMNHAGNYTCLAENRAGEMSSIFEVEVLVPPSIDGPSFRGIDAFLNQSVVIHCKTRGSPTPTIEWLADGKNIDDKSRETSSSSAYEISPDRTALRIKAVHTGHEGRYTCVATNKVGKTEADTFVEVMRK